MKPELERLGNEVMEVLVDAPLACKTNGGRENGLPVSDIFDKDGTFLEQIKKFKPDIVYFQTFNLLAPEVRLPHYLGRMSFSAACRRTSRVSLIRCHRI